MNNKYNIVLFDGECTFCAFWVKYILKKDKKDQFIFTSLQSNTGKQLLQEYKVPESVDSVVLISKGKAFIKSNAVFEIQRLLGGWRKIFLVFKVFPRFIRDIIYDLVAKMRYKLFKRKTCELPIDVNFKSKFI